MSPHSSWNGWNLPTYVAASLPAINTFSAALENSRQFTGFMNSVQSTGCSPPLLSRAKLDTMALPCGIQSSKGF